MVPGEIVQRVDLSARGHPGNSRRGMPRRLGGQTDRDRHRHRETGTDRQTQKTVAGPLATEAHRQAFEPSRPPRFPEDSRSAWPCCPKDPHHPFQCQLGAHGHAQAWPAPPGGSAGVSGPQLILLCPCRTEGSGVGRARCCQRGRPAPCRQPRMGRPAAEGPTTRLRDGPAAAWAELLLDAPCR